MINNTYFGGIKYGLIYEVFLIMAAVVSLNITLCTILSSRSRRLCYWNREISGRDLFIEGTGGAGLSTFTRFDP